MLGCDDGACRRCDPCSGREAGSGDQYPLCRCDRMVMTPFITADFVTSFIAAIHLRDLLEQKERVAEEMQKLVKKKAELEAALGGAGEKAKEQIRRELRELYMSAGAKKESMLGLYSGSMKSVRGLLRRNPTAVSPTYSETLAELKRLKKCPP